MKYYVSTPPAKKKKKKLFFPSFLLHSCSYLPTFFKKLESFKQLLFLHSLDQKCHHLSPLFRKGFYQSTVYSESLKNRIKPKKQMNKCTNVHKHFIISETGFHNNLRRFFSLMIVRNLSPYWKDLPPGYSKAFRYA